MPGQLIGHTPLAQPGRARCYERRGRWVQILQGVPVLFWACSSTPEQPVYARCKRQISARWGLESLQVYQHEEKPC